MDWLGRTSAHREFDQFVADSTPPLLRTAYLLTWNLAAAEDLVQETLTRVAPHWPRVHKMEHPYAYARRILVNLSLRDVERKGRVILGLDESEELLHLAQNHLEDERTEQALLNVDARAEVLWMLAALPLRQRAVLVLRYFDDLSELEIAEQLGWPVGTVKSTAARALDRLQHSFGQPPSGGITSCATGAASQRGGADDEPT
jgi:RNA polymerase sigma-70 factor (sigma-E family)